ALAATRGHLQGIHCAIAAQRCPQWGASPPGHSSPPHAAAVGLLNCGWAVRLKHWIIDKFARTVKKMSEKTTTKPESIALAPGGRLLILASTSRYRQALLERLGIPFTTIPPTADESALAGETPAQTALRLAETKARSVAAMHPTALIVGSDQVADAEGRPVGKPGDREHARRMLAQLSGRI